MNSSHCIQICKLNRNSTNKSNGWTQLRNENAGKKQNSSSLIDTVTCSCLVNVLNYSSNMH